MANAAVDNDILVKGACYGLLPELLSGFGGAGAVAVLGAARFVVRDHLARDRRVLDRDGATSVWRKFLEQAEEVEPSEEEIDLATTLEEAAADIGVALDSGESLLFAVAIVRPIGTVATGDKRAIEGIARLVATVNRLRELCGRVVCLEQLVEALLTRIGPDRVRAAICAAPNADRALAICFQCGRGAAGNLDPAGLESYIRDLRNRAPNVLAGSAPA